MNPINCEATIDPMLVASANATNTSGLRSGRLDKSIRSQSVSSRGNTILNSVRELTVPGHTLCEVLTAGFIIGMNDAHSDMLKSIYLYI